MKEIGKIALWQGSMAYHRVFFFTILGTLTVIKSNVVEEREKKKEQSKGERIEGESREEEE